MIPSVEEMRRHLIGEGYSDDLVGRMTDDDVRQTWASWTGNNQALADDQRRRAQNAEWADLERQLGESSEEGTRSDLAAIQEILRQLPPGAEAAAMPEAGGGAPSGAPTTDAPTPPPQSDLATMLEEPPPDASGTMPDTGVARDTDVDVPGPAPSGDYGTPGSEWGFDIPVAQEVPRAEQVERSRPRSGQSSGLPAGLGEVLRLAGSITGQNIGMPGLGSAMALIPDLIGGGHGGGSGNGGLFGGGGDAETSTSLQTALERLIDAINRLIDQMGGQARSPGPQADGSFVPSLGAVAGIVGGAMGGTSGGGQSAAPSGGGQSAAPSGGGQSSDMTMQIVMTILRMILLAA